MIPLKGDTPRRTIPFTTLALLSLNIAAFVYELSLPPHRQKTLFFEMGLVPAHVTAALTSTPASTPASAPGPALGSAFSPVLTSMFLHAGLLHLAGNMLFLWVFGNNVEDETGHVGFLAFYLMCGVAAAATQIVALPRSDIPMVGASGAIAGVLGAYMVLFPRSRILTLVPIFIFVRLMYLPAVLVLGLWFVYQVLLSSTTGMADESGGGSGGGVAFYA
ncbi:MAG TPA: rhomboid family intramembrane serine protease, partial [Patescibacteria group bacterium]|nr:rhomboid family intramembrane serine protease [Patescibacteria group bacterium]